MEKNKKSQRWGGEGWRPIVCVMPKSNGKQAPPLSFAITPTVTRKARHSPPSPLRKKSRFAKKKSASPKKNRAYHFSKSRIHQGGDEPRLPFFSKSRIYRIYQIAVKRKPAIGDGVLWTTLSKRKAQPEAQLGDSYSESERASEGRLWQATTGRDMPPLIHTLRHFLRQAQFFFRRSRLFFREAAFSSGDEGCEWGAKQPTVGESGDKAENEFSSFIPLVVPRKGFSPHIPASRLFVLFHPT